MYIVNFACGHQYGTAPVCFKDSDEALKYVKHLGDKIRQFDANEFHCDANSIKVEEHLSFFKVLHETKKHVTGYDLTNTRQGIYDYAILRYLPEHDFKGADDLGYDYLSVLNDDKLFDDLDYM